MNKKTLVFEIFFQKPKFFIYKDFQKDLYCAGRIYQKDVYIYIFENVGAILIARNMSIMNNL